MNILIGYSMRSGSTLLQHILNGHSRIRAYGDLSTFWIAMRALCGCAPTSHICVKPMDLLYLQSAVNVYRLFDRFIWLARDPRDSYLSTIESGYAYLFWPPGRRRYGIDIGLLNRWKRVYRHYFDEPQRWYCIRYEDLVSDPERTLRGLLEYLELPFERLYPFEPFDCKHGGDFKIAQHNDVSDASLHRFKQELSAAQIAVIDDYLQADMRQLGYLGTDIPTEQTAAAARRPAVKPLPLPYG